MRQPRTRRARRRRRRRLFHRPPNAQLSAFGRLVADPVERTSTAGANYTTARVAVNVTGPRAPEPQTWFLDVTAFSAAAARLAKCRKGSGVCLLSDLTKTVWGRKGRRSQGLLDSRRQRLPVGGDDAPHGPMMLTQTSDADPFIVCAIPDRPGDLAPRTIEAAYEDDAHYLGTLPAEYHLDVEQRELTKHPPAVDQVHDLLASLGFAAVQPFTAIAWTNRHEQPVVLVVAERDRLPIGQCDHGLRQTITRRPFRGPVAHPGNPDALEGHTELEQCTTAARCEW